MLPVVAELAYRSLAQLMLRVDLLLKLGWLMHQLQRRFLLLAKLVIPDLRLILVQLREMLQFLELVMQLLVLPKPELVTMLKQVLPMLLQEQEVFLVMHLVTLALKIIPAPQLVQLQSLEVLATAYGGRL
jgi:hypothetical protein